MGFDEFDEFSLDDVPSTFKSGLDSETKFQKNLNRSLKRLEDAQQATCENQKIQQYITYESLRRIAEQGGNSNIIFIPVSDNR